MKEIRLHNGEIALVDDEDYERLSKHKWYVANSLRNGYVQRCQAFGSRTDNSRFVRVYTMHREVLNYRGPLDVDHINRDKLDNRKCNLRLATRSQNAMNSKVSSRNKLGVKGVQFRKNRFIARITACGKMFEVGRFMSLEDARIAYAEAAKKYFGKFARTE